MGVRGDPGGLQQVPVAGWRAAVRVPVPLTGGRRSRSGPGTIRRGELATVVRRSQHTPSTAPCPARDPPGDSLLAFATGYVYRVGISSGVATRLPFPEGRPYAPTKRS